MIFGCLADKDVLGNVSAIAGTVAEIIAVRPDNSRGAELKEIVSACKKHFKNTRSAASVSLALDETKDYKNVIICGTFTILTEAKQGIEKRL